MGIVAWGGCGEGMQIIFQCDVRSWRCCGSTSIAVQQCRRQNAPYASLARGVRARCTWCISSGSRHSSLRVPQRVVGEHTAPLHALSARPCVPRVRKSVLGACHSCRVRRPKTIAHDDAIDASCVSSPHSVQDREVDVLMYPGQLAVRAIAIANLSAAACTFAIFRVKSVKEFTKLRDFTMFCSGFVKLSTN